MNTENTEKESYTAEYVIGAGYLFFFCIVFVVVMAFYYFVILQSSTPATSPNIFATSLPPTTPTPHFLPAGPPDATIIFEDDFTKDSHGWLLPDEGANKEVDLGKFVFESQTENNAVYVTCGGCPYLAKPFYVQADFSTSALTDEEFGIYFNYDHRYNTQFLFEINPEARKYYFFHYSNDGWSLRAVGESQQIKAFPAVNTIGIYADQGLVEFYVNGVIVDSYVESGYEFYKGNFGFFVDDSNLKVMVDNLVIQETGNQ